MFQIASFSPSTLYPPLLTSLDFHLSQVIHLYQQPRMTATPRTPGTNTTITDAERGTGIQFLSPAPPDSQPEIDYLASIRMLARTRTDTEQAAIEKGFFKPLFEDLRGLTQAVAITDSGSAKVLKKCLDFAHPSPESTNAAIYESIHEIRQIISNASYQGPCVLLVQDANINTIQALGAALDLEPSFFLRHEYANGDADFVRSGVATLDSDFITLRRQCDHINRLDEHVTRPGGPRNVHIKSHSDPSFCESIRISCRRVAVRVCKCTPASVDTVIGFIQASS